MKKLKIFNKWCMILILSVVIIITYISLTEFKKSYSKFDILREYYEPAKPFMIQRSSKVNNDYFSTAMEFYNKKDYEKSSKILLENQINPASKFYAAISLFELGDYNESEILLKEVISDNTNLFIDQAEWYLAFCYLMNNKLDLSIKQFEKLSNTQNYYNDKASEILDKIK